MSFLLILFLVSTISAHADILWQIGQTGGTYDEFDTNNLYIDDFEYDFGFVSVDNPTQETSATPGYLYTTSYDPISTYTTANLNIQFEIGIAYTELLLYFGRAGSEIDEIYLDGNLIASVGDLGQEGIWDNYIISLNNVGIGEHTLSIAYIGGGSDNGHFIDYLQLENGTPSPVPEPATMLLLGSGFIALAAVRKKFIIFS